MSRWKDVPEYWARIEVDDALRDMSDVEPGALADSFERNTANYDGDPEMAVLIAAELRRRATAGVRFWTGPQALDRMLSVEPGSQSESKMETAKRDFAELDDAIPW